ncbi:hypothetical protein SAMN02982919_02172 [Giesbergeria anulus]|uniref:Uncharacterized protein n=1 Tax=Giesbergeria anulus TaxID=180197 RepID=A0A1H9ND48_9BURK|nr:hypothetical protein SAMN02982919_02172 [Giesbergeria anulus]
MRPKKALYAAENVQQDWRHLHGLTSSHIPQQPTGLHIPIRDDAPISKVDVPYFLLSIAGLPLKPNSTGL